MKADDIHKIVKILAKETPEWDVPIVTLVAESTNDPF